MARTARTTCPADIRPVPLTQDRCYTLVCSSCGERQADDGLILRCGGSHEPALLRSDYPDTGFRVDEQAGGLFRYRAWLPVARILPAEARSVVFRGERLGRALGLSELWIAFSGYWPERGALFETGSFKDLEALTVLGRLPPSPPALVVASSGNTGAAFAAACSRHLVSCLIVVPDRGLARMRLREPLSPLVRLIVLDDAEYCDAIAFAQAVSGLSGLHAEGGVGNVGRRDGLATVLYAAFEAMGGLPAYYFQAVGSGAGAIAVHEAAGRLRAAAGGPVRLPRLMLCQNAPFTPIYDAWKSGTAGGARLTGGRYDSGQIRAGELANARPPFFVRGGVRDVLAQSSGEVMTADNCAVDAAMAAFGELELIDIEPAAATAVACLRDAVRSGRIPRDARVLLNISGGGRRRLERDYCLAPAEPALRFSRDEVLSGRAIEQVAQLSCC